MLNIQTKDVNYLAQIVKLPDLQPHPNADKLALVNLQNQTIITSKDSQTGDLFVLFQLESRINKEFLGFVNGFSNSEENRDKTKKGFFGKSARVRSVKIRGLLSEGYLHPVSEVNEWLKSKGMKYQIIEKDLNKEFDSIGNLLFVEKYVPRIVVNQTNREEKRRNKKVVKKPSRLIEGQLRLANDTENLKKNIEKIGPDDFITIGYKLHGCNSLVSKVLCKKKLKWYEKLLKKVGANIVDSEYQLIWASRRMVKCPDILNKEEIGHYYNYDIWGLAAEKYKNCIREGLILHGEIVGFLPNGSHIQKDYDYGCEKGCFEFYVYRIFYTSLNGDIFEFSTPQIVNYCHKNGLKTVPIFYYGKAKDLFPEIEVTENWHKEFLKKLTDKYTEKDCFMCRNKVPEEGVVIVRQCPYFEAYKLKSGRFLLKETESLDKGEVNIDDVS